MLSTVFGSNSEGRTLQQYASARLGAVRGVMAQYPESIPDIYPGYRDQYHDVVGRLFVPKHTAKAGGHEVRVATPSPHQHSQSIGFIAAYSPSAVRLDPWMVAPSQQQQANHDAFIAAHQAAGDKSVQQEMTGGLQAAQRNLDRRFHGAVAFVEPNHYMTCDVLLSRGSGQMIGGAQFMGMAPLIIDAQRRPSIDEIVHEIDHLVELDQGGTDWDRHADYRTAPIIREQRAYYVGLEFGRFMLQNDIKLDDPYDRQRLLQNAVELEQLDTIRSDHLGPGPVFGVTKAMIEDYKRADVFDAVYQAGQ